MDVNKRDNWSKRYKSRDCELKPPSEFLKNNIDFLKHGTVLDLACGDGANAVFLAKKGFEVTGVDFSSEALKRLTAFSRENNVEVETILLDVDDKTELSRLSKFDNIIISKFKPKVDVFKFLAELLNTDGTLILTSFNFRQAEISDFSRKYTLEEGEFINVSEDLSLLKLERLFENGCHIDGYIFKKKK